MTKQIEFDPATAVLDRFGHSGENTYAHLSELGAVAQSTVWHRAHGRVSNKIKGQNMQYLTPREEDALAAYFIRMSENGYPLPIGFALTLAHVIALQSDSVFYHPDSERDDLNPPGKNWSQVFHKSHPELKTK